MGTIDAAAVRRDLVEAWAAIENTPAQDRREHPVKVWDVRARQLAALEDRDPGDLVAELKAEGRRLADRRRLQTVTELGHDLAVSRSRGAVPPVTWERRLFRLAIASKRQPDDVRRQVEAVADRIRVSVDRASLEAFDNRAALSALAD